MTFEKPPIVGFFGASQADTSQDTDLFFEDAQTGFKWNNDGTVQSIDTKTVNGVTTYTGVNADGTRTVLGEYKKIDLSAEERKRKRNKTIFFVFLAVVALILLYFVFKNDD